jgi:hypothetical protein
VRRIGLLHGDVQIDRDLVPIPTLLKCGVVVHCSVDVTKEVVQRKLDGSTRYAETAGRGIFHRSVLEREG